MSVARNRFASTIPQLSELADQSALARTLQDMHATSRRASQALSNTPWSASELLDVVTFTGGETKRIEHTLGRTPVRWICEDVTTGYGTFRRTAWDATSISIRSANACTAVFRVE